MNDVTAVLSMLHEPEDQNSATRLFRNRPVLHWTLDRLSRCKRLEDVAILCWEDQLEDVIPIAGEVYVLAKGPRVHLVELDSISAARRWADGWRGGLLSTCEFDRGFFGPWIHETASTLESKAVVLIDPAAGLVDPELIDALIDHSEAHAAQELVFMPTAPGLAGVLLRRSLVDRMAVSKTHPGQLLHYLPDQMSRELLATESCAPAPVAITRSTQRFTLDSDRQISRISQATISLNGQLISSGAEQILQRLQAAPSADPLPREVTLELNTQRATRPIYSPAGTAIDRPELTIDLASQLIEQLAFIDDVRLTLAGVGDPLLADDFFEIVNAASAAGIRSIHVETDFIGIDAETIAKLAQSPIDIVTVHVPALTAATYERIMGVNVYPAVLENIRIFVTERHAAGGRVPILAPTFTKCVENLAEMEGWYDQWLRTVGSAVIRGPSECGGLVKPVGVADMAPPRRRSCARLWSRMMVLSDGRIVSCEEDVQGRQTLGRVQDDSIQDVWQSQFTSVRKQHAGGELKLLSVCGSCKEWHRP